MAHQGHFHRRSIDGGVIDATGPGDFSQTWATFADILVGPSIREVSSGPADWAFRVAEGNGVALNERYSYAGGDLYLGNSPRYEKPQD